MIYSLKDKKFTITILWFLLPAVTGFLKWKQNSINNYYIYKGVFYHLIEKVNLYNLYPNEYFDCNHYGPLFAYFIAPFALIPNYIAIPLWLAFQAFVLYKALMVLPIHNNYKWILLLITLVDLMTSSHSIQINPTIAGMIILSWYYVKNGKVIWAALFVLLGTFIKLYGIVGLAFWFFSKEKIKYIWYFLLWSIVLFILPMLISSPQYIVQTYFDWYNSLVEKNNVNQVLVNAVGNRQDISIMGLVRRVFGFNNFSNLIFIIPGFLLQVFPLLKFKCYDNMIFNLRYLASILIFVIIFSTSSESPTYIIATTGVAIWFLTQSFPIKKWVWFLLIFVIIITSLTATDLFPVHIRRFFVFYSIKALPCIVVWFVCIYQLFKDNNTLSSKWIIQN
jgi:Glycosyltransferase family 87